MTGLRRALIFCLICATPALALAQSAPSTFAGLANLVVQIITAATALLIGAAMVYYLWGLATSIYKSGKGGASSWGDLGRLATWGVLTFFVIFFVWAIIRVLGNTLFGGNNYLKIGL